MNSRAKGTFSSAVQFKFCSFLNIAVVCSVFDVTERARSKTLKAVFEKKKNTNTHTTHNTFQAQIDKCGSLTAAIAPKNIAIQTYKACLLK